MDKSLDKPSPYPQTTLNVHTLGIGAASRTALLLSGGGAHAAYQAGVLKAVTEWLPDGAPCPFSIVCGSSAGAINAMVLASKAGHFAAAVDALVGIWRHIRCREVFRTEPWHALRNGTLAALSLLSGGLGRWTPRALLDNTPLRALLERHVSAARIAHWIERGVLHAVGITAAAYGSGLSTTFFQGRAELRPWTRTRRIGVPRALTLDHLLASSAIPLLFPAVRIGGDWFGDGSMRQTAPLSPALHLGAERILVIGARHRPPFEPAACPLPAYPSLGQIAGYILDTLFMDSLSFDIERLQRVNATLARIPLETRSDLPLHHIELLGLFPSEDVRVLAERHSDAFPPSVRYLLRGIGATRGRALPLISYLLFEAPFCRELIALGYRDASAERCALEALLGLDVPRGTFPGKE